MENRSASHASVQVPSTSNHSTSATVATYCTLNTRSLKSHSMRHPRRQLPTPSHNVLSRVTGETKEDMRTVMDPVAEPRGRTGAFLFSPAAAWQATGINTGSPVPSLQEAPGQCQHCDCIPYKSMSRVNEKQLHLKCTRWCHHVLETQQPHQRHQKSD